MGLLSKALSFREELLKTSRKGLLYKALRYLESKNSSFPEIVNDFSDDIITPNEETDITLNEFSSDTSLDTEISLDSTISDFNDNFEYSVDLKSEVVTDNDELETESVISIPDETIIDAPIKSDIIIEDEIVNENLEIPSDNIPDEIHEEVIEVLETVDDEIEDNSESITFGHSNLYLNIIDTISRDMSTLIVNDTAYLKFLDIISNNFKFSKSALLIYFPPKQKFILWNGKNLDEDTSSKLNFDLEFNSIYKNLSKEKSFFLKKEDANIINFSSLFSDYDFNDSRFLLWIPFIFSARIIGIFLGLKLNDRSLPSNELIESLEIIGRLNGPLLYNLYQQETIKQQQKKIRNDTGNPVGKKNQEEEIITAEQNPVISDVPELIQNDLSSITNDLLDDYDKNQTDNIIVRLNGMEEIEPENNKNETEIINANVDVESVEYKDTIEHQETELKEVDLFDIFPESIHKLIYFAQQTISSSPSSPLTLIHIQFENNNEIQDYIPNFRFETFYSDIQFVIMNVVGTNGFVQILRDMNIYIVLPDIKKNMAVDILNEIIDQLEKMFIEIHENVSVKVKNNVVNYPDDVKDYLDMFYKIQKL